MTGLTIATCGNEWPQRHLASGFAADKKPS
jgi:hypothetical protein